MWTGGGQRSTRRRGPARRERCLLKLVSRALVILSLFSLCHSAVATSAVAAGHARWLQQGSTSSAAETRVRKGVTSQELDTAAVQQE